MKLVCQLLIATIVVLLLNGCVMGRRHVDLNVPDLSAAVPNGQTVYVAEPVDQRNFENDPDEPSTPSIDGDVHEMNAHQRAQMIGRQRNTYGGGMGDVALPEGITVNEKMQQLVLEVFESKGFASGASNSADYTVQVGIQQFWAWFTPGMWTISFEAQLSCQVTVTGQGKRQTFEVTGYGINNGQVASDANWQLAYSRAFGSFVSNLQVKLGESGY